MKKTFTLIVSLVLTVSLFAFPNQSRLTITSVSKVPVRVVVDGRTYTDRDYNLNEVEIRDIRPGYHSIKVFQQRGNRYGSGSQGGFNSMRLIYESRIYVKPNYHVDILINRFGKALVDERRLGVYYNPTDDDESNQWNKDDQYQQAMDGGTFEQLKQTIRNESFDATRLAIAKQAVGQQYVTSAQVKELVQLFSFEDSKLDLAKHCYRRTLDKHNYFTINDAFSFSSSKEELARFIQTSK